MLTPEQIDRAYYLVGVMSPDQVNVFRYWMEHDGFYASTQDRVSYGLGLLSDEQKNQFERHLDAPGDEFR